MKAVLISILLLISIPAIAKKGCCSWHGGVDYCAANGRIVCNDGTYSPSCTCNPSVSINFLAYADESDQKSARISYIDDRKWDSEICNAKIT